MKRFLAVFSVLVFGIFFFGARHLFFKSKDERWLIDSCKTNTVVGAVECINDKYALAPAENAATEFYSVFGYPSMNNIRPENREDIEALIGNSLHGWEPACSGLSTEYYNVLLKRPAYKKFLTMLNEQMRKKRTIDIKQLRNIFADPVLSGWMRKSEYCIKAFSELSKYDQLYFPYYGVSYSDSISYPAAPKWRRVIAANDAVMFHAWSLFLQGKNDAAIQYFFDLINFGLLSYTAPDELIWKFSYSSFEFGFLGLKILARSGVLERRQKKMIHEFVRRVELPSLEHLFEVHSIRMLREDIAQYKDEKLNTEFISFYMVRFFHDMEKYISENTGESLLRLLERLEEFYEIDRDLTNDGRDKLSCLCTDNNSKEFGRCSEMLVKLGFLPEDINCKNRKEFLHIIRLLSYGSWTDHIKNNLKLRRYRTEILVE